MNNYADDTQTMDQAARDIRIPMVDIYETVHIVAVGIAVTVP